MDNFKILKKEIEELKHEIEIIETSLENSPTALEIKLKKEIKEKCK